MIDRRTFTLTAFAVALALTLTLGSSNALAAAPTATNMSAFDTYIEDTPRDLTDIVISDVDGGTMHAWLTLSNPAAGTLSTASSTAGAATSDYIAITGMWQAYGPAADVNMLLAELVFTPALNFNANFTISTNVSDGINWISDTKPIAGMAVNDPPAAWNLSAPETYTDGVPLNLTDIGVSDPEGIVHAQLTLSNPAVGTLSTATSGSTTSTYNAATGLWQVMGLVNDVNTLLAGVTFTPTGGFGVFTIATVVGDPGSPPLTGTKTFTPTNRAPTATNLSTAESYTEGVPLNLTDIVVSDPDGGTVYVSLRLSGFTPAGTLSTGTAGAATSSFSAMMGQWTAQGPVADVNTLLAGVTFIPAPGFNSSFTIFTQVMDGSPTGFITGSKVLTGIAVNDAPTATNRSAAESYTEDTVLNLADIVVSDIDNGSVTATLTLSNPAAGSLSTATSGAVTSTYNAGAGVWTASGAIAHVNTLLAGVTFIPTANFNTGFTIATSVSDGIAAPVTGSKPITGIAVADAATQAPAYFSCCGLHDYTVGDRLFFIVDFDASVFVTGTPQILVHLDSGDVYADRGFPFPPAGTATTALQFHYTIQPGDFTDGFTFEPEVVLPPGVTIEDIDGNDASVAAGAPILVAGVTITPPSAPVVTSVGVPAPAPEAKDTTPPTKPAAPVAMAKGGQMQVTFGGSTDNIKVVGYRLYRDDTVIGSFDGTSFKLPVTLDKPGTLALELRAVDAAGNLSEPVVLTLNRTAHPKAPKVKPAWAWKLARWQDTPASKRGVRPHTPSTLPTWHAKWNAWHKAPVKVTVG